LPTGHVVGAEVPLAQKEPAGHGSVEIEKAMPAMVTELSV